MIDFEIHPLIGVGAIEFGMTPSQVAYLIGPPDDFEVDESNNERREFRRENGLQAVYSENRGLVELGFSRNISELCFYGKAVFSLPELDVINQIIDADNHPYFLLGFVVFLSLGITLTGFHDENEDQKAVTVFEKGRWDSMKANMKPFKL